MKTTTKTRVYSDNRVPRLLLNVHAFNIDDKSDESIWELIINPMCAWSASVEIRQLMKYCFCIIVISVKHSRRVVIILADYLTISGWPIHFTHVANALVPHQSWCKYSGMLVQGGMFPEYDQTDAYVLKWNLDKFGYPKYLHIWAAGDWDIPSKLRFDTIYPWVVILASRQFRAAYWLITTKTWVVGGTLLTQSSSFSTTGKLCSTHLICGNLVLSQRLTDPILTDAVSLQFRAAYWLNTTKLIHMSLSEILTSLVIRNLFTTFKTPSVAIMASRQFRVAYWLITTKTSVVGGTPVTLSFRFLNEREIMYHSPYMWKSCSHPKLTDPYLLTWCHVNSWWHISWVRPNCFTCPEVKSCKFG